MSLSNSPTQEASEAANPREDIRQRAIKVIEKWKMFWMNQIEVTKDQADHDNYFHRALGVDANMKYHLAGLIADEFQEQVEEMRMDFEGRKMSEEIAVQNANKLLSENAALSERVKELEAKGLALTKEFDLAVAQNEKMRSVITGADNAYKDNLKTKDQRINDLTSALRAAKALLFSNRVTSTPALIQLESKIDQALKERP